MVKYIFWTFAVILICVLMFETSLFMVYGDKPVEEIPEWIQLLTFKKF